VACEGQSILSNVTWQNFDQWKKSTVRRVKRVRLLFHIAEQDWCNELNVRQHGLTSDLQRSVLYTTRSRAARSTSLCQRHYTRPNTKRKAQLSQRDRTMLRVIKYSVSHSRSLKVVENCTIRKLW